MDTDFTMIKTKIPLQTSPYSKRKKKKTIYFTAKQTINYDEVEKAKKKKPPKKTEYRYEVSVYNIYNVREIK